MRLKIAGLAVLLTAGTALAWPGSAAAAESPYYVDPATSAARWVAANPGDSRAAVIRDRIAAVPQGRWFTANNPGTVAGEVDSFVGAAAAVGKTPILVVYNIPNRDCSGASSGGLPNHTAYRQWIDQVAAGLKGRAAAIILEPDVLALMTNCLTPAQQQEVYASMAYAGKKLKAASATAKVYFDAANSAWLAPAEMAARLVRADIANSADGISVNVSNYRTNAESIPYIKNVIAATGDSSLRVSSTPAATATGRLGSEWCDPAGRAIGIPSTNAVSDPILDAYLWIKLPGEADGCIARRRAVRAAARLRPGDRRRPGHPDHPADDATPHAADDPRPRRLRSPPRRPRRGPARSPTPPTRGRPASRLTSGSPTTARRCRPGRSPSPCPPT